MTVPPGPRLLPLVDTPTPERRDAARNRAALLEAAERLMALHGAQAVTMDAVAAAAGVGKGTVFRRFGSRQGLLVAVLDRSEAEWQASVMSGPPPLGPGADPWDRLLAFGRSRLETALRHSDLIRAAGWAAQRSAAAYTFTLMHARFLLAELGVTGDLRMFSAALMAPLEVPVLDPQVAVDTVDVDLVHAGWVDIAARIVGRTAGG